MTTTRAAMIAAMQIPLGAGDIAVIESAEPLDDFQASEIERRVRALYDQLAKAGNVKLVKLGPADTLAHDSDLRAAARDGRDVARSRSGR
jgi:F420-0:gamma-glutamyl ligase